MRDRGVAEAPARAKHGLGRDLVGDADPRCDGVRIGVYQVAIAAARAGSLIEHRAEPAVGIGIGNVPVESAGAIPQFPHRRLQVVAQTVIEGQLAADLPGVLHEEAPRRAPVLRIDRVADGRAVVGAQQEAGEVVADAGTARKRLPVERLAGFRAAETIRGTQADVADIGEGVDLPLAAGLVTCGCRGPR